MAIDMKEFTQQVDTGLKANKKYDRFFYRFKVGSTAKRGLIDYSGKNWDKKERIKQAKAKKLEIEEEVKYRSTSSQVTRISTSKEPTLNDAADLYFNLKLKNSVYAERIEQRYILYCNNEAYAKYVEDRYEKKGATKEATKKAVDKVVGYPKQFPHFNKLGKEKLQDILSIHLDELKNAMEETGYTKQTANGCSLRTIKEVFHQVITPILKYAKENKLVRDYPVMEFKKQKKKKKKVTGATQKLTLLFNAINDLYKDDPFYRSLFLFGLYGRRWGEISTLHWSEVDFINNTYTILEDHCKIDETQTYDLPAPIAAALLAISDDRTGLIFKSPITGKELYTPKKQLAKIREKTGIEDLTMHFFRHILVTAMGEQGVVGTVLSASLGHTDLDTVNDFYLTASHTKASATANKVIEGIIK